MQKGEITILFIVVASLLTQTAGAIYDTSISTNGTFAQATISNALNLYAYEIDVDYTNEIINVNNYHFLTACSSYTSGSSKRDNILSIYESCLDSSKPGTNGSGVTANITYNGTLSLRYTLAVYANGSTEYTYYNTSSPPSPGGGSSGGGGATVTPKSNFDVTPNFLKVTLKQGQTLAETITVKNLGTKEITISITSELISDFIVPEEDSFTIAPGESKDIGINFFAKENEPPNTHTGKIYVSDGSTNQTVNVVVEVKSKSPLFDAFVEIKEGEVLPGEDVTATIRLLNMGDLRNIDVLVYYAIKDFDGNTLAFKKESIAIETRFEIVRSLKVPNDAKLGQYVFYTKISYNDVMATGSEKFDVVAKKSLIQMSPLKDWLGKAALIILITFGICFLIYGIIMIMNRIKLMQGLKKAHESRDSVRESIKAPFARFN